MSGDLLVELRGVTKDYGGLRPLRVQSLELHSGASVAVLGFDAPMSEVLVNLITAAQLPDLGDVRVFGSSTRSIGDVDQWVRALDQFGLVSERAVLVDQLTAEQNLAMPISLEVENMSPALRSDVHRIASEVALSDDELRSATGELKSASRLRLRLGRALAARPRVLLAEHPNAQLKSDEFAAFAADFKKIVAERDLAALVTTADASFATAVADQVLTLQPATGVLTEMPRWRRWFS
jgi:putative ABC transport system ATP-binding protein